MDPKQKKAALLTLKFACSALLLWLVLRQVQFHDIIARFHDFDWRYAALGVVLWVVNLVFASWRWSILSLGLIPIGQAFRYTWIGFFFGSVLPGAISGDVAKGVSLGLKDKTQRADRLSTSIFLEKLTGLFSLLIFFTIASGFLLFGIPELFGKLRPLFFAGLVGCFVGIAALFVIWRVVGTPRAEHWADTLPHDALRRYAKWMIDAFRPYRHENAKILQALILSSLMHTVVIAVYWMLFTAVNSGATLLFAAVFYSLISIILVIPVSISGIGLRDGFSVMMFTAFNLQPEAGVAVSWLMLGLNVPIILIGGAIQIVEFFGATEKPRIKY